MAKWKRYVVGLDDNSVSRILHTEGTMVKEEPGVYYRVDLWCTAETPVNNTIAKDRALDSKTRAPVPGGTVFRALELPPDSADAKAHREAVAKLHAAVDQKHTPSEKDYARHPSMHRTDTLDMITCVKGECWLLTDADEVCMKPGDSVVIRGSNHGWSNRGSIPALLIGVMVDAVPLPHAAQG
jgi:hypothetical protein